MEKVEEVVTQYMPEPTSPVVNGLDSLEVAFGLGHEQYRVLPSLVPNNGVRISRWTLTDEERALVSQGHDIYISVHCAFQPPVRVEVGTPEFGPESIAEFCKIMQAKLGKQKQNV